MFILIYIVHHVPWCTVLRRYTGTVHPCRKRNWNLAKIDQYLLAKIAKLFSVSPWLSFAPPPLQQQQLSFEKVTPTPINEETKPQQSTVDRLYRGERKKEEEEEESSSSFPKVLKSQFISVALRGWGRERGRGDMDWERWGYVKKTISIRQWKGRRYHLIWYTLDPSVQTS